MGLNEIYRSSKSLTFMESLFAKYTKESGKEIIENEKGFVTYYFIPDGCYIEDVYIEPKYRLSGAMSSFGDQIASIAKEKGVKTIFGSVNLHRNGCSESLLALLKYGFKLDSTVTNGILLRKGI